MLSSQRFKRTAFALGVIGAGLAFSAPAFAAKDKLYAQSISNVLVGGAAPAAPIISSSSFPVGASSNATLDAEVPAGQTVQFTLTWKVQNNRSNNPNAANTAYPRTVNFSTAKTEGPDFTPSISSGQSTCALSGSSGSCTTTVSFVAPATPGTNYQLHVTGVDSVTGQGSNVAIEGAGQPFYFNFSVAAGAKIGTTLVVSEPNCHLLNAGNVNLAATLKDVNDNALSGKAIDFTLGGAAVGSANTDASGLASLAYSINGLSAGDYNLYAAFAGDAGYEPSNDSATFGISYVFVGFQQPINPEGNSVFGNGRVIPIKIRLADANGNPVTDAQPTVWMAKLLENGSFGEFVETASVSAADTSNFMRYVASDNHYIYNWDLSTLTNGVWKVMVNPGDSATCRPNPYEVLITVNKKGGK